MASSRTVLFPLPDRDCDPTEVAVPWRVLTRAGHRVVFATEAGVAPVADPLMLTGVLLGTLGARPDALACYRELEAAPEFQRPMRWADVEAASMDALFLAGGHAPGMRQYLEGPAVHALARAFFERDALVAAICHGVVVLARTLDASGRSVLQGRRTTCLPKYMERSAYWLTFWKVGRYYRTYPTYVEDEVRAALASPADFERGPRVLTARGTDDDDRAAFVVEDGSYLSARWPGDAYLIAKRLCVRLA